MSIYTMGSAVMSYVVPTVVGAVVCSVGAYAIRAFKAKSRALEALKQATT